MKSCHSQSAGSWGAGVAALLISTTVAGAGQGASFVYLPNVFLRAVSADGNSACGSLGNDAVRWTRQGGVQILPQLPGYVSGNATAHAMSWDGRMIVGSTSGFSPRVAWIWVDGVGISPLEDLVGPNDNGYPECISGNGQVVSGASFGPDGLEGVIWQDGTVRVLPRMSGGFTAVQSMTFSGEVMLVVEAQGSSVAVTLRDRSFNLTSTVSTSLVQFNPAGLAETGDKVFGKSGNVAAVWTSAGGVETVPNSIPGGYTALTATGMSADGRVLVGSGEFGPLPSLEYGWIWQQNAGMRLLQDVAREQVSPAPSAILRVPAAVSTNGRTIVGQAALGPNGVGAFVLTMNAPCAADVDDGTGTGARDDNVTIADLSAFLDWMSHGDLRADLDDGSGNGVPDVSITIDDLIYFLGGFEVGC